MGKVFQNIADMRNNPASSLSGVQKAAKIGLGGLQGGLQAWGQQNGVNPIRIPQPRQPVSPTGVNPNPLNNTGPMGAGNGLSLSDLDPNSQTPGQMQFPKPNPRMFFGGY